MHRATIEEIVRSFPTLRSCSGALLLLLVGSSAAAAAPLHYVYEGAGCNGLKGVPIYEALLGRKVDGVVDFFDYTKDWPHLVQETAWATNCWKGKVSNLAASVPLAVSSGGSPGVQFADIAAGKMDSYYAAIAQSLVSSGFSNAYVRLGWEFNGGWYPWRAAGQTAGFVAAWRHVVDVMRRTSNQKFQFVWNPALGMQQVYPDQAYPGDAYVDVIAVDAYNSSWNFGTVINNNALEPRLWNAVLNDSWGVGSYPAFAKKHGKPYAFPEWGTGSRPDGHGGGDDPTFVTNMLPIIDHAAFEGYWDYNAGDYNAQLTDGTHPVAAAIVARAYSSQGSKIKYLSSTWSTNNLLPVSCINCQAAAIQNGPSHWNVIVWSRSAQSAAQVSWKLSNPKVEMLNDRQPGKGHELGSVNSVNLRLEPYSPIIISVGQ